MYRISHIVLLLALFASLTAFSSPGVNDAFRNLNMDNGLSQNSVLCMVQDIDGFMWFGTKDGLNRYDGNEFKVFKHDKGNWGSLGNDVVNSLCLGPDGKLWVGTDAGIWTYDSDTELFSPFVAATPDGATISGVVYRMEYTAHGTLFIGVEQQGLFLYDIHTGTLSTHSLVVNGDTVPSSAISAFASDFENRLWIAADGYGLLYTDTLFSDVSVFRQNGGKGSGLNEDHITCLLPAGHNTLYVGYVHNGLQKLNILTEEVFPVLPSAGSSEDVYVRNLLLNDDGSLLVATENGMFVLGKGGGQPIQLTRDPNNPFSLSDNAIYSMFYDDEGGLWVGSYFGGIDYLPPSHSDIKRYYPNGNSGGTGTIVREMCDDGRGNIWIGTENSGLFTFNTTTRRCVHFDHPALYHNIHALCRDGAHLWVGTFSQGLWRLNLETRQLTAAGKLKDGTDMGSVFSLLCTSDGTLYAGTPSGLYVYDRSTGCFQRIDRLADTFVFHMIEDVHGTLWFATYREGLFSYNPRKGNWTQYASQPNDEHSLPYNKLICVAEGRDGSILVGTQGRGFARLDVSTGQFTSYDTSDGLPNGVVYRIEDTPQGLWLTTNDGLVHFSPETATMRTYTVADGLLTSQFNYGSSLQTSDGVLWFGGIGGFISFHPDAFAELNVEPHIAFTDFLLFNKRVAVDKKDGPLLKSITHSDTVVLSHRQNSFAVRFSTLSYVAPQSMRTACRLEGFDKEWYSYSGYGTATYTNIPHGEYSFCVRSLDPLGQPITSSEKRLTLIVRPPLWQTSWAYCLYVFLSLGILYVIGISLGGRIKRRQQYQIEFINREKEKEIFQAKIEFFTNIAHEIRTPLSLIKAPLEVVLHDKGLSHSVREDLEIMQHNTDRLLDLTNQLLDFRRADTQGYRLNFVKTDISRLVSDTYVRFVPTAKEKGLSCELNLPQHPIEAQVDREALIKMLSNLFNNAVKYSHTYIEVVLEQCGEESFKVSVCNDGDAIPQEKVSEIFHPFVRLDEGAPAQGYGIGLPLARSLAELHGGTLSLENAQKERIVFALSLPVHQQDAILTEEPAAEMTPPVSQESELSKTESKELNLLVVEDNTELRSFISKVLEANYNVLVAGNGKEALEIIENNIIHLILSDVMMPEMDGFELCRTLKDNVGLCHIPIILLTARHTLQSKIEGIEQGADDYIEKPFSFDYLNARITNLLEGRQRLRQSFTSSPLVGIESIASNEADEQFLRKLVDTIHEHLTDTQFSVDTMAETLGMSRSSLHRKIKEQMNLTPGEFILLERLKTAAQMLSSGNELIKNVCYATGFSSTSYFAKCFKSQFGVLPSEFVRPGGGKEQ